MAAILPDFGTLFCQSKAMSKLTMSSVKAPILENCPFNGVFIRFQVVLDLDELDIAE